MIEMLKKLIVLVFSFVLVFGFYRSVVAKTVYLPTVKVTPTATPTPTPVDSFSLFWPMSAGKTMQSKIYFLKTLKEQIRGFFIFGSAQKASYEVFLGTKRMLEAEFLMKGNVPDIANKTLDSASSDFDKANSALTSAKNSGDIDQTIKDEINTRVSNLKKFTSSLMIQYPNYKDKLQDILNKLNTITL